MFSEAFEILEYKDSRGLCHFRVWLDTLDNVSLGRIQARLLRMEHGGLGDCKKLTGGLWEVRFFWGPGYRIYFGMGSRNIIVLLTGGNKKSQDKDIKAARKLWRDFLGISET